MTHLLSGRWGEGGGGGQVIGEGQVGGGGRAMTHLLSGRWGEGGGGAGHRGRADLDSPPFW